MCRMREVTLVSHLGLDCALPSHQVLTAAAAGAASDVPEAYLWPPHSDEADYRLLEVQTASGRRRLRCANVKLGTLTRENLWAIPRLLQDILQLPHVVGLAEIGNRAIWLVDLKRFHPSTEL